MTDKERSKRLATSRSVMGRKVVQINWITSVTYEEQMVLKRAMRGALAREGSSAYLSFGRELVSFFAATLLFTASLLSLPGVASLARFTHLAISLTTGVWLGFVFGWLAYFSSYVRWLYGFMMAMAILIIGFGVGWITPKPFDRVMFSALFGFTACMITFRVNRAFYVQINSMWMRWGRYRSSDQLVVSLISCAVRAHVALAVSGKDNWKDPDFASRFVKLLRQSASRIERAPRLSRRTTWTQFSLRSDEDAAYFAVAAILRSYATRVVTAKQRSDWELICQSLVAGAIASAREDWTALLANAPTRSRARRSAVMAAVRRLAPAVVLAGSGLLLPAWIQLGTYGPSVRAVLLVAGVLSLLPKADGVEETVTGVLTKALPFR